MSTPRPVVHAAREQVARLLALVPYLHSRGEVRLADAAAALGVDPDQLDKDLRVLFMCGLPGGYPDDLINVDLDALEGDRIIRVDNADYLARPVSFAPSEAAALVVALQALAQSAAPETQDVVRRTLAKFEAAGQTRRRRAGPRRGDARAGQRARARPPGGHRPRPPARARLPRGQPRRAHHARRRAARGHAGRRRDVPRRLVPHRRRRPGLPPRPDPAGHRARHAGLRAGRRAPATSAPGWFAGEGSATTVTIRLAPPAHWVTEYYPVTDARPGPGGSLDVDLEVASEAWLRQLLFRVAPHAERRRTPGVRRLVHCQCTRRRSGSTPIPAYDEMTRTIPDILERLMIHPLIGMPQGAEWLVILAIVVLVFGAAKLPELARGTGQALRIFKTETKGLRDDEDDKPRPRAADRAAAAHPHDTTRPDVTRTGTNDLPHRAALRQAPRLTAAPVVPL